MVGRDALWVVGFARCSRMPNPKAKCSATAGVLGWLGGGWVVGGTTSGIELLPAAGALSTWNSWLDLGDSRMPKPEATHREAQGTRITVAASSMSTWNLSFLSVLTVSFMVGLRNGKGERGVGR